MNAERARVVVTGLGVVSPLGIGKEVFWERLVGGQSGVRPITLFDASTSRVQIAAEVPGFDPRSFMEFKEAQRLARVGQLAVAAAELLLVDQNLDGLDRERVATIVSSGLGGPDAIFSGVRAHLAGEAVSPLFIPMAMANLAVSVIARRYGLAGPSYAPLSACASSADAVGQGFRMIRDGYVDACIVGGAEGGINPVVMSSFASMRALSRRNDEPARASRPFDAARDGFVLGEGACILLLETAASAERRGAHVYAEVAGYGQTSDAYHLTAPRPEGERVAKAMRLALAEAQLEPHQLHYINAHGTGTALSDPAETKAIRLALGEHADCVAVSSTKSMLGHLLGAAGAIEAAICALTIERGVIPPTINLDTPDPECDLDYVPNVARQQRVDSALSNSQAFGGHNVALAFRRLA